VRLNDRKPDKIGKSMMLCIFTSTDRKRKGTRTGEGKGDEALSWEVSRVGHRVDITDKQNTWTYRKQANKHFQKHFITIRRETWVASNR